MIPNFGQGSSCVRGDHTFCWDWVRSTGTTRSLPRSSSTSSSPRSRSSSVSCSPSPSPCSPTAPARSTTRSVLLGAPLHDPEPRALPVARALLGHHVDDGRGRARRLHARRPLPEHLAGLRSPLTRGARGRARDGPDAASDALAGRAALAVPAIIAGSASQSSRRSRSPRSPRSSCRKASAIRSSSRSAPRPRSRRRSTRQARSRSRSHSSATACSCSGGSSCPGRGYRFA